MGCSRKTYCWRAAQTLAIQWSSLLLTELPLLKEYKSKQLKLLSYTPHQPQFADFTGKQSHSFTLQTFLQHFINFIGTASPLQIINAISLLKESYFINCKVHIWMQNLTRSQPKTRPQSTYGVLKTYSIKCNLLLILASSHEAHFPLNPVSPNKAISPLPFSW